MLEAISKKCTKRNIQIALGVLWIIDGLLQLQHRMFTPAFAHEVIAPAADGQPVFISGVMHFFIHMFLLQPFVSNVLIIVIQLGIGLLLIRKSTVKYGIMSSIVWGLFVWYIGEGLGGLFSGSAWLLMGAPGAALFYAIIAYGVRPTDKKERKPSAWLAYIWAAYWFAGAILQLTTGQNTTTGLIAMIAGMADGVPGWISQVDLYVAHLLAHANNWLILLIVLLQVLIGVLVFFTNWARYLALCAGIVISLGFWIVGQNLGGYFTGLATDPNTAPLVILLALAVLGAPKPRLDLL